MAQYTVVHMKDDLDGTEADQTIYFSLDNKDYVIDLNDKNAEAFRAKLTQYIDAGRKRDGVAAAKPKRAARGASPEVDPAVVREWAREAGHEVSDRGRVSLNLIKAYHEAH